MSELYSVQLSTTFVSNGNHPLNAVHLATWWQVDEDGENFSTPLVDTGWDTDNLTNYLTEGLFQPLLRYLVRVRLKDGLELESEWSTPILLPIIVVPPKNPVVAEEEPLVEIRLGPLVSDRDLQIAHNEEETKLNELVRRVNKEITWEDVDGKPVLFVPTAHTHLLVDIEDYVPLAGGIPGPTGLPGLTGLAGEAGTHLEIPVIKQDGTTVVTCTAMYPVYRQDGSRVDIMLAGMSCDQLPVTKQDATIVLVTMT